MFHLLGVHLQHVASTEKTPKWLANTNKHFDFSTRSALNQIKHCLAPSRMNVIIF